MENNINREIDIELHQKSGQTLLDYLKGKDIIPTKLKVAMSGYNGSTRALSTYRVGDAMQYTIIKDLATNPDELRKYVKATLPDFIPNSLVLK